MKKEEYIETITRVLNKVNEKVDLLYNYEISDDTDMEADFGFDKKDYLRIDGTSIPYKVSELVDITYKIFDKEFLEEYEEKGYIKFSFDDTFEIKIMIGPYCDLDKMVLNNLSYRFESRARRILNMVYEEMKSND